MKLLAAAAFAALLLAPAAAAQAPRPGPEWVSVTPRSPQTQVTSWLDTTAVEVVGTDRFRVRTMLLLPRPLSLPLAQGGDARFNRMLDRVEYDCTRKTVQLLESAWMLDDVVAHRVPPTGETTPWPPNHESGELTCQAARRAAGGAPAAPR